MLKKKLLSSTVEGKDKLLTSIQESTAAAKALLQYKDSYASKGQLDNVGQLHTSAQTDLEREKNTLKEIETKLSTAQKLVEGKESRQQEIKSARMEDEVKLQELLSNYENLSSEAIALEQKLAASLKNLDSIMDEIELTQDQKGALQELSNSLTAAGARLRDLLTEYEQTNQRLENLRQQHVDLEDEYTKLVEQQLGD
jgi:chromosome segregation ATPase